MSDELHHDPALFRATHGFHGGGEPCDWPGCTSLDAMAVGIPKDPSVPIQIGGSDDQWEWHFRCAEHMTKGRAPA